MHSVFHFYSRGKLCDWEAGSGALARLDYEMVRIDAVGFAIITDVQEEGTGWLLSKREDFFRRRVAIIAQENGRFTT